MHKFVFMFGAGAEVAYGVPAGGQFAFDVLRHPTEVPKQHFSTMRQSVVDKDYIQDWLPYGFDKKRIVSFQKVDRKMVFESTVEHKKSSIRGALLNLDNSISEILHREGLDEFAFKSALVQRLGFQNESEIPMGGQFRFNPILESPKSNVFNSLYLSAAVRLSKGLASDHALAMAVVSMLQLYLGAIGKQLVDNINDSTFNIAPDDFPILNEIGGVFGIDLSEAGMKAFDTAFQRDPKIQPSTDVETQLADVLFMSLIEFLSSAIDYQSLVDGYYRYLFAPKSEWSKFTKISIFLLSVYDYMDSKLQKIAEKLPYTRGFYDDIAAAHNMRRLNILAAGTSNYTSIIDSKWAGINTEIFKLNGDLSTFYDPYRNEMLDVKIDRATDYGYFNVPFMFTQSGIKPLTTVGMSRRYVDYFDLCSKSDAIVVCGYGFNGDDAHINGLFRELIDEGKMIIVLDYTNASPDTYDVGDAKRKFVRKLRLRKSTTLKVIPVDRDRLSFKRQAWLDVVLSVNA